MRPTNPDQRSQIWIRLAVLAFAADAYLEGHDFTAMLARMPHGVTLGDLHFAQRIARELGLPEDLIVSADEHGKALAHQPERLAELCRFGWPKFIGERI